MSSGKNQIIIKAKDLKNMEKEIFKKGALLEKSKRQTLDEKITDALKLISFGYAEYLRNNLVNCYVDPDDDDPDPEDDYEDIALVDENDYTILLSLQDAQDANHWIIDKKNRDPELAVKLITKLSCIWDSYVSNKMYPKYDENLDLEKEKIMNFKLKREYGLSLKDTYNAKQILREIEIEQSLKDGFDKDGQLILI